MKAQDTFNLHTILQDLVSYKSVERNLSQKNDCLDYIANRLSGSELKIKRGSSNGLPWLISTTQDTKHPKVLLQAHIDVVPGNDELFEVIDIDNKLKGRGVYDMKFAVACFLQLVEELKPELEKYDLGLMFTSDEEIGGENGVGYLLDQGYGTEICILPDGGNNWNLQSDCNGVWIAEITAKGKTAHGSRPWEGDNAITKLLDCIAEVQKVFPMDKSDKNTITVSRISGGNAINQVPEEAKVTFDMRFVDEASYASKRIEVESCISKAGLELETSARVAGINTDPKQPYIAKFMEIAKNIRGKSIECGRSYGSSDAHYFAAKGIPVVLIRPDGGSAHGDDEWIDQKGLQDFYRILKAYVKEVARTA